MWKAGLCAALMALFVAGCDRGHDPATEPKKADAASQTPVAAPAATGEALYQANCAQCHEGQVVRAPHHTILGLMAPHRVVAALDSGVMQEQG